MANKVRKSVISKTAKGVRIKTEKELIAFLNSHGVAKKLKFLGTIMLPPGTKWQLKFSVGESSYTDMKGLVVIGIPTYMIGRTKEEILADAKWRLLHELGHMLYTDDESYRKFIEDFRIYMNTNHGISEAIGQKAGNTIINSAEDGREENVSKQEDPGNEKYFQFGRSQWYFNNEISEVEPGTEIQRELFDTLFCLATLSTMGVYPKNYATVWAHKPELLDMVRKIKPLVNKFVNCCDPNPKVGLPTAIPILWTIVYEMEDWMVDLMKQIPEPDLDDLLNKAQQQGGAGGSTVSSGSYGSNPPPGTQSVDPGGVSQDMSGGDPNNKNGQGGSGADEDSDNGDESESDDTSSSNNGNPNDGGRITRVNDSDDTEYDTDMDEIVEEAMKNAMNEIIEDEYDEVQQADFEDMLWNQRNATEEDEADPQDVQAVEDYYSTLDSSKRGGEDWAVPYREKRYNYAPIVAPSNIKLEAKMLNKEFQKIFLNKAAIDSKNRRRGMLNTNDLYKIHNKDFNLFMKKGNPKNTDFVFYILVDGSGSMSGDKFTEALRACSVLEESLKGIAPVKIVMFDYDSDVRHRIIKDFKECSTGNASWTFANHQRSGCCNMDGFSIRVASKELQRRSERRKILFTLSDGQPNGPYNYSGDRGENDVTEAVLDARKNGISVFNIFFAESKRERDSYLPSFRHMYRDKGIISCAPEQIAHELLRVVKRELQA